MSRRYPTPAEEIAEMRGHVQSVATVARGRLEPRSGWARLAWWLSVLVWAGLTVWTLVRPGGLTVVEDGQVQQLSGWEALILVGLALLLLPMPWMSRLLLSPQWAPMVNMPHKDFWVRTPARLARGERLMWEFLALSTLVTTVLCALPFALPSLWADLGWGELPAAVMVAAMGGLVIGMVVLLVWGMLCFFGPERSAADLPLE